MVLPAIPMSPSTSSVVALTKIRACPLRSPLWMHTHNHKVSVVYSAKFRPRMQQHHEPSKLIVSFNHTKEKLQELVPDSVKHFSWKKAESVAVQETLVLGKEILKWTSIGIFALSFLSDIIYSISRNKELVIPFGLYVGCMMANFFDEISKELIRDHKDGNSTWGHLGIGCFFVVVKVMSQYFSGGKFFLLHAANGGLMQILWKWRKSSNEGSGGEYASISTNGGD